MQTSKRLKILKTFSPSGCVPVGKMFNEYSNLKFITLMIQAASMFFSKGCCKVPEVSVELWFLGSPKSNFFFSFIPVIEDSGVKLEQNE